MIDFFAIIFAIITVGLIFIGMPVCIIYIIISAFKKKSLKTPILFLVGCCFSVILTFMLSSAFIILPAQSANTINESQDYIGAKENETDDILPSTVLGVSLFAVLIVLYTQVKKKRELKTENEMLKTEFQASHSASIAAREKYDNQIQELIGRVNKEIEQSNNEIERNSKLNVWIEDAKKLISAMNIKIAELENKINQYEQEIKNKQEIIEKSELLLSDNKTARSNAENENQLLKKEISQLKADIEGEKASFSKLNELFLSNKKLIDTVKNENDFFKNKVIKIQADGDKIIQNIKNDYQNNIMNLNEKISQLKTDLEEKQAKILELNQIIFENKNKEDADDESMIKLCGGKYIGGRDIEEGIYDVIISSGSGYIKTNIPDEISQYLKKDESEKYNNLEICDGTILKIDANLSIKLHNKREFSEANPPEKISKQSPSSEYYDYTDFDKMDGHKFERFCADVLIKRGYNDVEVTRASGDQGVDIIASRDGIKYAVQCKRYSHPVGNSVIQEIYTGKQYYGCHIGVVMTNNYFTQSAKSLGKKNGVILWDRNYLIQFIKESEVM